LCITAAQVDTCLRVLDGVLGAVEPVKVVTPPPVPTGGTLPVM
jgi:hypothetical protein